ncbi:hypothetical protein KSP39_PZI011432 [Platanthera zijinensis]|uniref:Uncharacterized protein n=1 Tax=Platanthera zijinensis TaxID=2320716 RepID=A0AAP0BJB0_9ASPA
MRTCGRVRDSVRARPRRHARAHPPGRVFLAARTHVRLAARGRVWPRARLAPRAPGPARVLPRTPCRARLAAYAQERALVCQVHMCAWLSLDCYRDWCDVRSDGGERVEIHFNKSWLDFEIRTDLHHRNTLFGYVRNSWGLSELWGALPDRCCHQKGREREFSPVLEFSGHRELANRLFSISSFVEEKRLLRCGIFSDFGQTAETSLVCNRKQKVIIVSRGSSNAAPCSSSLGDDSPSGSRGGSSPEVQVLGSSAP